MTVEWINIHGSAGKVMGSDDIQKVKDSIDMLKSKIGDYNDSIIDQENLLNNSQKDATGELEMENSLLEEIGQLANEVLPNTYYYYGLSRLK